MENEWQLFLNYFCDTYLAGYSDYQVLIKTMYKNGNDPKLIIPTNKLTEDETFQKTFSKIKIDNVKTEMYSKIAEKLGDKYRDRCEKLTGKTKGKAITLLEIIEVLFQKFQDSKKNQDKNIFPIDNLHITKLQADLKDLNYEAQIREFKAFLSENFNQSIGAFLIHGKDKYGQRWLVNRLIFNLPYWSMGEKFPICLKKHRHEINRVWETLQWKFGSTSSSPEDVITAIYERWEKEPVILCFDNVNEYKVRGDYLRNLISQFWQPLAKKAISDKFYSKYPLILFLIDREGCPDDLDIELLNSFDINKAHVPVKLTELLRFKESEIGLWVKNKDTLFNPILSDMNLEKFIALLVQCNNDDNKTPEDVLDQICGQFTTSDNLSLTWKHFEKTLPL
ncbi:hypothetical protein [Anabaena sp. UHCC 0451]|uniref:hypothetical protein n=1 Tax=Anabaena sp. UHCC 0451 TaxID=2055235 RepID=UPI002B1EBAC5|nr:hypothetical protein [Anabaena sp. UHCC 0451]MEA5577618.1 hypothetical protein [Anabaena sp. UHCC 0451]